MKKRILKKKHKKIISIALSIAVILNGSSISPTLGIMPDRIRDGRYNLIY